MAGDLVKYTFYLAQLLWFIDSYVLRNPPLRQAPNRWQQMYGRHRKEEYHVKKENK
jgi:hypothetical protein